ncbi:transporter [Ganoderma sinense ZZ0214-1]|uniref:Transporter n=1 Tax=Ganoderma sinense ZZ0214-1 TaxID=1077348 RepID=A0A2G8SG04_9APHY|nr:transporter [Ganoderma sinense ZZ0214-1]
MTALPHTPQVLTVQDALSASVGNWQAILTLVLFLVSNVAVIFPLRVPIPRFVQETATHALVVLRIAPEPADRPESHASQTTRRRHVHLNFITVPLLSVLVLLAAGVFDGQTLRDGVLGTAGIQPLNIMALFISLAYISISLDATGLFRFLAFWVASKGGSSGRRLYAYLYGFFLVCGVVVGNDPVILSGTAFLAYFTRVAGITPPTAWIFSQFAAANMASVVLVSSNPTNLVLSGAFALSFLSYAAHVVLPFAAAALCVFPLLLFLFLSRARHTPSLSLPRAEEPILIPRRIEIGLTQAEVRATLVDARGAAFGSALLLATLAVLVGVSTVGVPVWEVTVPPAVVMFARDVWHDWSLRQRHTMGRARAKAKQTPRSRPDPGPGRGCESQEAGAEGQQDQIGKDRGGLDEGEKESGGPARRRDGNGSASRGAGGVDGDVEEHALHDLSSRAPTLAPAPPSPVSLSVALSLKHKHKPSRPPLTLLALLSQPLSRLAAAFPTATHVLERLPLALVPFALLMFVLVQGLAAQGWVALFARGWAAWVRASGVLGAVGGMGVLACLLCNFCGTNIGATILLARVLQLWSSSQPALDPRERDGALYALALGSNFGAFTLTFSASLAGLLWRQILRQKGIHVRGRQFLLLNLPISFVAMAVGCAVLVGQVYVEHGRD